MFTLALLDLTMKNTVLRDICATRKEKNKKSIIAFSFAKRVAGGTAQAFQREAAAPSHALRAAQRRTAKRKKVTTAVTDI